MDRKQFLNVAGVSVAAAATGGIVGCRVRHRQRRNHWLPSGEPPRELGTLSTSPTAGTVLTER
jgi:hypothetical protein